MDLLAKLRKPLAAGLLAITLTAGTALPAFAAPMYKDTLTVAGLFPWSNWQQSIVRSKNMGFTRARMDFMWHWVEKSRGNYDFSFYDGVVNTMAANGLKPVFILAYNNALYSSNNMYGVTSQGNLDAYCRFVRAAANRYKGKGVIWELWNEPDLPKFWGPSTSPSAYAKLAQAGASAIRSVDPNAYIVTAGFAHKNWNKEYIRQAIAAGALRGVNAMAVHSYDFLNPPMVVESQEALHAQFRTWMSQYNGGKVLPIVDTEFGASIPWQQKIAGDPWDYAAKQSIRMYLDHYHNGVYMSSVYGMNDGGDLNLYKDTPVTKALTYTNKLLANYDGTKLNYGSKQRGILFTNRATGKKIIAWWPVEGTQTVAFSSPIKIQGAYNVFGAQRSGAATLTKFTGSIFGGPIFFVLA